MIARRVGAVVASLLLVVGAVLVRRAIDDDDAEAGAAPEPSEAAELVCITELADVCRSLADERSGLSVIVEDAGRTLDRLAALDDSADAPLWLTIEPYPEMVDELRRAGGLDEIALASSAAGAAQLAVGLPDDGRGEALVAACGTEPLWRCIGERADTPWVDIGGEQDWGAIDPSLGDVEESAVALASFADAVAGYLGDTDVSRSRWENDPGFVSWLRRLAKAVPAQALSAGSPIATMATRESAVDVAATSGAEIAGLGATSADVDVRYPEPTMWVEAVLAIPAGTSAPAGLGEDTIDALAAAGWSDAVAATAGLPSPGVMIALRSLWAETA